MINYDKLSLITILLLFIFICYTLGIKDPEGFGENRRKLSVWPVTLLLLLLLPPTRLCFHRH